MDGRQVGALLRAVRIQQRLTQREVAARAKVGQSRVSLAERGRLETISFDALDAIAAALDVIVRIEGRWRGTGGARLLDRAHASIVEVVARTLTGLGWQVLPEYTFNHFGERGSVDIVAWFPLTRALLVVEVKSQIVDLQDLFATLGRKVRIVPGLLRSEFGWRAASVSRLLVLPGTTANRNLISRHAASFAAALPAGSHVVRRWLHSPSGPLAGVWFISPSRVATVKQAVRVRRAGAKAKSPPIRA